MTTRKLTTSAADAGLTLGAFVAARLAVPAGEADRLVGAGAVYLERRRVTDPAAPLAAGQRVTVHLGGEVAELPFSVAYESAEVLVADKPAGMPTQATRERAAGALDEAVRARWPGATALHRLDRDASGLVLFVLDPAARGKWQTRLTEHRLERRYAAVVRGHPPDRLRLDRPIGPDPADPRRRRAGQGDPAVTEVEVVRRGRAPDGGPTALLAIRLETGRTHQIRVHLADAGYPIYGDWLYDPAPPPGAERLFLHACELRWPGGRPVVAPAPAGFEALVN